MDVAIGVDSHKETLAAAAVDQVGRELGGRVFSNDPNGAPPGSCMDRFVG